MPGVLAANGSTLPGKIPAVRRRCIGRENPFNEWNDRNSALPGRPSGGRRQDNQGHDREPRTASRQKIANRHFATSTPTNRRAPKGQCEHRGTRRRRRRFLVRLSDGLARTTTYGPGGSAETNSCDVRIRKRASLQLPWINEAKPRFWYADRIPKSEHIRHAPAAPSSQGSPPPCAGQASRLSTAGSIS